MSHDGIPDPLVCPSCRVLLRDGTHGLTCPSCGHVVPWEAATRPEDGDTLPGVRGG